MPPAAPQKPGLSFITLLSYDYRYAFTAIRSYYDIAGEIILGLDADRLTWSQHPFQIDMDELHSQIKQIDIAHKLRLVEGNFHASQRPMDNDTNERSELSLQCSPGNWIVQIDCDETLMNAREFRDWLINCDPQKRVHALWFSVFKVYGDRALVIHPPSETPPIATQLRGQYDYSRRTKQNPVLSPLMLLHFSWGRTPDEVRQKLANWSHTRDFDTQSFLNSWESLTLQNYRDYHNFHPIAPALWRGLALAEKRRQNNTDVWYLLDSPPAFPS
ncbi:MAG: hypothetical protein ABSF29_02725 [Tepidisphaeraceae bacterium]|jgi:hypothetical protein